MNFESWEPVYEAILDDFGFDRKADERARDLLATFAEPFEFDRLDCSRRTVAVVGAAPSLEEETEVAADCEVVIAASTAADTLLDAGIGVDCMVTDLDKNVETARALTQEGVPVAAHAHGDNLPAVEREIPEFDLGNTLATTQAAPVATVYNLGGFTDGDRAAFLADHLGAERLAFVGWAFDDPSVGPMKARKLVWAERLLYWLEVRRGERFPVLDGRRSGIDTSAIPV